MNVISEIMHAISDHGNAITSKILTYFGVASVGTGGTLGVVNNTALKIIEPDSAIWTIQDTAACVSIIGGVCLIIKTGVDMYFKIKNGGKD